MLPREGQPVQRPHDRVTLQDAQPVWRGFSHLQKRWGCCCLVPCHVHLPSTVIPGEGLLDPCYRGVKGLVREGRVALPGAPAQPAPLGVSMSFSCRATACFRGCHCPCETLPRLQLSRL